MRYTRDKSVQAVFPACRFTTNPCLASTPKNDLVKSRLQRGAFRPPRWLFTTNIKQRFQEQPVHFYWRSPYGEIEPEGPAKPSLCRQRSVILEQVSGGSLIQRELGAQRATFWHLLMKALSSENPLLGQPKSTRPTYSVKIHRLYAAHCGKNVPLTLRL